MKTCIQYLITGRVQGVWYRSSAQKQANKLNITGWAKNLPDGRVQIFACGEAKNLDQFHQWLWKGPILAKVQNIDCKTENYQNFEEFSVK